MNERLKSLLALLLVAPAPSVGVAMAYFVFPGDVGAAAYTVSKVVLYGFPLVWLLWIERGRLSASPMRRGGLGVGLATGLLIAGLILGAWWMAGPLDGAAMRKALAPLGFNDPLKFLALAAWMSLANALLEEYAFRWFVFSRVRALLPTVPAVAVAGVIFTAHHVLVLKAFFVWPIVAVCSAGVLVGGLTWSALYARYRSIWPCWISHLCADVAIFAIGYVEIFGI